MQMMYFNIIILSDQNMVNVSKKRRGLKNDVQRSNMLHAAPVRDDRAKNSKTDQSEEVQQRHKRKKGTLAKDLHRQYAKTKIQPMGTKCSTRLSVKTNQNCNRQTSDLPLPRKKAQVKGDNVSKINLAHRETRQTKLHRTLKLGEKNMLQRTPTQTLTSKVPKNKTISNTSNSKQRNHNQRRGGVLKNANQSKDIQSKIQQSTITKTSKIPEAKMMKKKSNNNASKRVAITDNSLLPGV
jgi:hypothetical protein